MLFDIPETGKSWNCNAGRTDEIAAEGQVTRKALRLTHESLRNFTRKAS